MKATRLLTLLVFFFVSIPASGSEPLWDEDKPLHLGLSAVLGGGIYAALTIWSDQGRPARLLLATSLTLLPGLAKEIHDAGQQGNHFSHADMLWNLVGALAGAGIGLGVDLLVEHVRGPPAVRLSISGPGAVVSGRF
jgi:uncharacterized protein YfiM (DUF2279 family)